MAIRTLTFRSVIFAPADVVYAWHARPGAFERLVPPWMDVRVEAAQGTVTPGSWKQIRLALGPVPVRWKVIHEASSTPFTFVDVQEQGPFRSWRHEHVITPRDATTCVLEDRLTYELPLAPVAEVLAGPSVERALQRVFQFRHRRTQLDISRHVQLASSGPLRIAVTGASGLVGRHLVPFLTAGGHEVITLVRRKPRHASEVFWDPATGDIDAARLEGLDAVVHLAGVSIASGRWTKARKTAIRESRVHGTSLIARTLAALREKPKVLVSSSAIGFYGDAGNNFLTEMSPPGLGFLAEVCRAWEEAASPAADAGIRVAHPRTGVVIAGSGGVLPLLLRAFRIGVGGPLGDGQQFMSWIALDDLLGAILTAIVDDRLAGPVNAVSPYPVTNQEFAAVLGRVLNRPAKLRVPAPLLRLAAGELADELLLTSQRGVPQRLQSIGYTFAFDEIEDALRFELGRVNPTEADFPIHSVAQP